MTTPMCEDGGPLREWAPLTTLLQQIPAKIQNGIFTHEITFTCIDAVSEFIAVGTNHGLVYWFNRDKHDLQRLRCENINAKVTCVQVISTVDYMVAAGNEHGVVTVFQIPKCPPDSLPENLKQNQKKQVERYTISGLHKSAVTTVEWSKNGMKLFSGDEEGLVVLTEIDFYMHLSKSSELLNEKYSVVQLNYQQGLLLVSTTLRTILVNRNENGKVIQVGQKERKTLGKLGAVFGSRQSHMQDIVIYASRPGLRLWQADKMGTVLKTLIFKDAVRSVHTEVELLNPAAKSCRRSRNEPAFGIVLPFCDDLLVTYGDDVIYVVNPQTIAITSIVTDLRHVTDIACTKDEIFVLEGERNIIRLAYYPDKNNFTSETKSALQSLASFAELSRPVTAGIMELTLKLKDSAIVPAIPFHNVNPTNITQSVGGIPIVTVGADADTVVSAEEAVEVPPVVPINVNTQLVAHTEQAASQNDVSNRKNTQEQDEKRNQRNQIFQKISQQEFEDVVFTPERKAKKLRNIVTDKNENGLQLSVDASHSVDTAESNTTDTKTVHSSLMTLSIDDTFTLKSRQNLETIQKDVENKEKLLADVLDFDLSKYMSSSQSSTKESSMSHSVIKSICDCDIDSSVLLREIRAGEDDEESEHSNHTETESEEEDFSYRTELKKLEDLGECRKKLLQNKLSNPVISNNYTDFTELTQRDTSQHELEFQFNVSAKECVTSSVPEDEDWVVVPSQVM